MLYPTSRDITSRCLAVLVFFNLADLRLMLVLMRESLMNKVIMQLNSMHFNLFHNNYDTILHNIKLKLENMFKQ